MATGDAYAELLGITVSSASPDRAEAWMIAAQEHCNLLGLVHGGAIFSLADAALAAVSNSAPGRTAVASTVTIHLLKPARAGDRLSAIATGEHAGKRLGLYRIEVLGPDGMVAIAHGQVSIRPDDP